MDSTFSRIVSPLFTGLALTLALSACSSDKSSGGGTGGAAGASGAPVGTGGAAGAGTGGTPVVPGGSGGTPATTGGMTGSGGSMSTGGTSSGGAAGAAGGGGMGGDPYVCFDRTKTDPGMTGAMGTMCCGGTGTCADPTTLMGDAAKSYGHDTCLPTLVCSPPTPTTAPKTCTTKVGTSDPNGLEGRCIPKCYLLGNPLAGLLDDGAATCAATESCAPCYNPVDGKSTGACNTGTDMPAKAAPMPYKQCPEGGDAGAQPYKGGGLCVPGAVVDKLSDKMSPLYNPAIPDLKQDNCAMGEKCVPALKAANPGYCSQKCTVAMALAAAGYGEGACTPTYVIFDTNAAAGVTIVKGPGASMCDNADELCAPCKNPLKGGIPSGACY